MKNSEPHPSSSWRSSRRLSSYWSRPYGSGPRRLGCYYRGVDQYRYKQVDNYYCWRRRSSTSIDVRIVGLYRLANRVVDYPARCAWYKQCIRRHRHHWSGGRWAACLGRNAGWCWYLRNCRRLWTHRLSPRHRWLCFRHTLWCFRRCPQLLWGWRCPCRGLCAESCLRRCGCG